MMQIIVFDTETTGLIDNRTLLLAKQPEIIEFFAQEVDLKNGEVSRSLDLLVKPHTPVTAEITRITGLKNEDLTDAPPFAAVSEQIKMFLEDAPAVAAHNLSFDQEMIDIEFERLAEKVAWPARRICTVEQTVHLTGIRLSLSALHLHLFGEEFKGAHRARVDVEALTRCCVELYKRGEL